MVRGFKKTSRKTFGTTGNELMCQVPLDFCQRKIFAAVVSAYIHHTQFKNLPPTAKSERSFSSQHIFLTAYYVSKIVLHSRGETCGFSIREFIMFSWNPAKIVC